jgi:hypothetical protein
MGEEWASRGGFGKIERMLNLATCWECAFLNWTRLQDCAYISTRLREDILMARNRSPSAAGHRSGSGTL